MLVYTMQTTKIDFSNGIQVLILLIALIIVALVLYLAARIIAGQKEFTGAYFLRLFIVAIVIFIAVVGISALIGELGTLGQIFSPALPIIIFTVAIYIIKFLLTPATRGGHESLEASLWIALITFIAIYLLNYITYTLTNGQYIIVPFIG